jgi:SAM-dependent methyltransferase
LHFRFGAIVDIGGGNGYVSLGLTEAEFNVALVEPGRFGKSNAIRRGLKNVICATTDTARFQAHSLPAVGLFDVIEHIEDDVTFLESMRALMKKGGRLYATVPAYSFLWSDEDDLAGHFKRYTLESAGFEVEFSTYIFRLLPIPIFLLRALPYKIGLAKARSQSKNIPRDHGTTSELGARVAAITLHSELENLKNRVSMMFSGSCLVVARIPD